MPIKNGGGLGGVDTRVFIARPCAVCYSFGMKKQTFQLVFESDPDGGYTVTVPALPGCVTYGKDMKAAREMARDAIELYVEDMLESGERVPQTDTTLLGSIEVAVARA